ncbi:hypothetical protein TSAR_006637 [Trichomalopsis sarcophagae]|uniref:Uncharacterized protein n=1 Tax=Trichomalopsis sarcophagae TaxID=543379 RepID=A0A232EXN6_9HYME|nr:hypothetical protein TSAR_006637 [Trichomalopsis sarcophagae]
MYVGVLSGHHQGTDAPPGGPPRRGEREASLWSYQSRPGRRSGQTYRSPSTLGPTDSNSEVSLSASSSFNHILGTDVLAHSGTRGCLARTLFNAVDPTLRVAGYSTPPNRIICGTGAASSFLIASFLGQSALVSGGGVAVGVPSEHHQGTNAPPGGPPRRGEREATPPNRIICGTGAASSFLIASFLGQSALVSGGGVAVGVPSEHHQGTNAPPGGPPRRGEREASLWSYQSRPGRRSGQTYRSPITSSLTI